MFAQTLRHRDKTTRLCGQTVTQLKAIVVNRFFETEQEAMAWTNVASALYDASSFPARITLRTARAMINL
jgi:hypothetical protein